MLRLLFHGVMLCIFLLTSVGYCESDDSKLTPDALSLKKSADSWIVGSWGLTYDPDGNDKDYIEFISNGHFLTKIPGGKSYEGNYHITGSEVIMTLKMKSKEVSLHLRISQDKSKLTTESGSYYTKE